MGGGEQRPWVVGSLEGGCSGARAHYWSSVMVEVGEGETVVWFVGSLRSERRHGEGRAHGEVTWALESEGKETMEVCFELRVVVAFIGAEMGTWFVERVEAIRCSSLSCHGLRKATNAVEMKVVQLTGGSHLPATMSVVASVLGAFNSTTRPSGPGARVGPGRVVDWVGWLV
jgi:hypothetical protein